MRGKPHKLVIVAIARMPVIIANAILKTGVPWRQYTRWTAVSCTVRILSAAAPEADWSRHRHLVNRLSREARRSRSNRKTGRVLPSGMLLDVGERLASAISQEQHMALASALTVRDGAMVALIALMPMRRRSFSELRLGTSVLVSSERIVISLSPEMTKNGLPWEAQVPESGVGLLRRYIDQTRPWLMNRVQKEHDTLWIGRCGEPLTDAAIADRIATVTARMTGVRVSPHLFRDAAATTLARQSPADARLIRPLLAHSGFGTAERHYIQAQGIETGRDFASVIAELSKGDG
jgi:site-specific recombinase XerD